MLAEYLPAVGQVIEGLSNKALQELLLNPPDLLVPEDLFGDLHIELEHFPLPLLVSGLHHLLAQLVKQLHDIASEHGAPLIFEDSAFAVVGEDLSDGLFQHDEEVVLLAGRGKQQEQIDVIEVQLAVVYFGETQLLIRP
jgi:hypothetical protein